MAVVNEKKKVQDPAYLASGTQAGAQKTGSQMAANLAANTQKKTKTQTKVNPYAGLTGISANTAQQIANAQQGYQSPYATMLNGILEQITHPQEFNYEFNKDNLFKAYSDLYTQQGRQASLDAQGQAAQLTGGYGNSYGAAVGNQAYQQWLTKLYDKGLDFYDRARQRYNDDWNMLLNQYDVVNGQDQQGYQQWLNNLNYWTGLGQTENQGYMSDQQFALQQAQWEAEQAAAAAAAAAHSGGGPGGNGGGNGIVYATGGNYYTQNANGGWELIPESQALNGNYQITEQMNNPTGTGLDYHSAFTNIQNGLGDLLGPWGGKKKNKNGR